MGSADWEVVFVQDTVWTPCRKPDTEHLGNLLPPNFRAICCFLIFGQFVASYFWGNLLPQPNFWVLILWWFVVAIFLGILWLAIHNLWITRNYRWQVCTWGWLSGPGALLCCLDIILRQSRAKERPMMRNKQNIHPFFQPLMNMMTTWMMRWRELRWWSCCGRCRGRLGSQVVVHVFTCTGAPDFT